MQQCQNLLRGGLSWIGARARWALAFGVVAALVVPGPGALLAGSVPFWVAVLFALAMMRIDLGAVLLRAVRPRRLLRNIALLAVLMGVTPLVVWAVARGGGVPHSLVEALVYTTAAPPLGSATAFCLMLGLDAAFALELTVLGSFLAPFTMPLVVRGLLGDAVPVEAVEMLLRLGLLIGAASLGAILVRRFLGAAWIEERRLAFDGLSSVILVLFLFPLFYGIGGAIGSMPMIALWAFGLAMAANLGVQIASFPLCRAVAGREAGGATSLIWGNRNAALTLAFLPDAPIVTLYIALYQLPMYFTPLVMRPVVGRARDDHA